MKNLTKSNQAAKNNGAAKVENSCQGEKNEGTQNQLVSEGVMVAMANDAEVETPVVLEKNAQAKRQDTGKRVSKERRKKRNNKWVQESRIRKAANGIGKFEKTVEEEMEVEGIKIRIILNKSQKETLDIQYEHEKKGIIITFQEAGVIKQERRLQAQIGSPLQADLYFKTLKERVGSRCALIVLLTVIHVIQGRADMPTNNRAYQIMAVSFATSQTGNISGFFGTPFPGNALLISRAAAMLHEIQNFENEDGTGSATRVAKSKADLKVSVDLFVDFINSMCILNQSLAPSYIEAAKLVEVKYRTGGGKKDLTISHGEGTGDINLVAKAIMDGDKKVNVTYNWRFGVITEGVLIWKALDSTPVAHTIAHAMPIDVKVLFSTSHTDADGVRSGWIGTTGIMPE